MKSLCASVRLARLLFLTALCCSTGVDCQPYLYRASFEAPTFSVGALASPGQDGWTGNGEVQSASPAAIHSGEQSLMVYPSSTVSRAFAAGPSNSMCYIDGYYRGPTISVLPDPTTLGDGSSLVVFHETQGILALDGNGSGGGVWVPAQIPVSTNFQRITLCQNYQSHTWTLYVDKVQAPLGAPRAFGFKNNLNQLNGIDIETSEKGKGALDDFTVSTQPPDFFRDALFDFSLQWKDQDTPFTLFWDVAPIDGKVDGRDLLKTLENRIY